MGASQAAMGRATDVLTSAETAVKPFHEKIRKETTTMDQVTTFLLAVSGNIVLSAQFCSHISIREPHFTVNPLL